ncbi:DNA-3-methyladenine glycosylase I [Mycobacterium sp. E2479]|uniref:DNA-3-methyladenine glycosylase I n=1 Tax=Mycobacterium sp. E2479 TaxID=1834134 RepID=UPI001E62BDA7|nr:DNA-3-methyladenine glycosylase I [Mycobacterium sp. E2479]
MAGVDMPPHLPTVLSGPDGVVRCRWATETGRDLTVYHDVEWGRPTHDEVTLFEALVLTYFENGLSWATVFDKRENLRAAFHGFDPAAVAAMTDDDVERLMADASIIRNRRKIEATLHNARLLSAQSLAQLAWKHQPRQHHRLRSWADGRMTSPESYQLAKALRETGFRHAGPVVAHSFMQTVGIENGHFEGCFRAVSPPSD